MNAQTPRRALLGALAIGALAVATPRLAQALPGTHAPAVSTYDTRASSIVVAYRHGSSSAGGFDTLSYNANFSSTSGKLSSQFGLHYVRYHEKSEDTTAHGVAGGAVALFELPVAERFEDGTPKAALAFHLGAVPTAYVSGPRNFMTLPFVLGFGAPLSPASAITITPWYELAIAASLDTIIQPVSLTDAEIANSVNVNQMTGMVTVSQSAAEQLVRKSVKIDIKAVVPMRLGLDLGIHLGRTVDLNGYGMISSLGGAFKGTTVLTAGFGFVVRWDDIVPALLPSAQRLDHEPCEAVEERFRSCPNSRNWRAPAPSADPAASPLSPSPAPPLMAPVTPPLPPVQPAEPPKPPSSQPSSTPPGAPAPAPDNGPVTVAPPSATFPKAP